MAISLNSSNNDEDCDADLDCGDDNDIGGLDQQLINRNNAIKHKSIKEKEDHAAAVQV
jgi:hypothetical protein